jgi:GntR family transcriptional regulator, transcriptional repressor for pyruvate dehydrogenase complex
MSRGAPVATATRRTEKKCEALARQILRDVVGRRLRPGAMLPSEAVMLEDYEVGRTTLREALRILEVQGVLSIRPGPGGGPVVGEPDSRGYARASSLFFQAAGVRLVEVLDARLVLAPAVARLAAERRDGAALDTMRAALERIEAAAGASGAQLRQAAHEFLGAVAEASGQPVLSLVLRALDDVVVERIGRWTPTPAERMEWGARLAAIGRAILRGNADAAARLMREHMAEYNRSASSGRGGALRSVVTWG